MFGHISKMLFQNNDVSKQNCKQVHQKKEGRLNVKPKSFAKATEEDKAKKRKPKEVPAAFRGQKIDLTDFTIVYVSLKGKKF